MHEAINKIEKGSRTKQLIIFKFKVFLVTFFPKKVTLKNKNIPLIITQNKSPLATPTGLIITLQ